MKSSGENGSTYTSLKLGGNQIEFEDEDPAQHREFLKEIESADATCQMCDYYPLCPKKGSAGSEAALCPAEAK